MTESISNQPCQNSQLLNNPDATQPNSTPTDPVLPVQQNLWLKVFKDADSHAVKIRNKFIRFYPRLKIIKEVEDNITKWIYMDTFDPTLFNRAINEATFTSIQGCDHSIQRKDVHNRPPKPSNFKGIEIRILFLKELENRDCTLNTCLRITIDETETIYKLYTCDDFPMMSKENKWRPFGKIKKWKTEQKIFRIHFHWDSAPPAKHYDEAERPSVLMQYARNGWVETFIEGESSKGTSNTLASLWTWRLGSNVEMSFRGISMKPRRMRIHKRQNVMLGMTSVMLEIIFRLRKPTRQLVALRMILEMSGLWMKPT
ncbi:hypothetical protein L596_022168 [Steinernema carpocapsae]|uniref:Uncharacterized protein n=1 Tax=Steinernema carpocapsae TaxID=34508 RepID=A0A4U5MLS3_STECR|nr:hypothetical protein L596_022168 [Steinernema carpocapsae]